MRKISLLLCLLRLPTIIHAQTPPPTPVIVWNEEFNYASDEAVPPNPYVWVYETGRGPNNDGWGNGELQTYTDALDNVKVTTDGNLEITVVRTGDDSAPFTSGRIWTSDLVKFKYGTITMKAKTPDVVVGLWVSKNRMVDLILFIDLTS
jgi:hypothetical protein